MKPQVYGIKNCDTMKKARTWLEAHGIGYDFHDYKLQGIDEGRLRRWIAEAGWQMLLNRTGTTFRKLPESGKADVDESKALALMLAQPSMIRRPVVESGGQLLVGFKPESYASAFL
jgi:arsenate reductase (glutaredoxin)